MSSFPPHRLSQDQQSPVIPQKPPARRGSISGHEPRLLVRRNSGNGGTGDWADVDSERRSRNRSTSTPPDNRHHHPVDHRHRPAQGGQMGSVLINANESWTRGRQSADTRWGPGHTQVQVQVQVQVRGQRVGHGGPEVREGQGQKEGYSRGRVRRSSDVGHPTSTPAPALRRMSISSPADSSPVIPGITTAGGMGIRNLLRKNPPSRPKILFYNKDEPYYGFTNFSPHPVVYRGKTYPTSEHLFQSLKVGVGVLLYLLPLLIRDTIFR